ncbi:UNVERIFIED_ORG: ABC-type nitrate/sulfonate/bicarbonate transport system substrate-binding protein [Methylobacterium sp. SuP10 SLI 274]|uniref:ABC transporter substrate-binding protein n=1 Tax=Methylorubrum extorquens TaxID=408 RepID=UPI0020A18DED|nr:NrtA/SsuA/CpmA family ABC transporter substrate-binding protein [Methylorubrum extorquens]MDF9861595.1 ABC-type nitrate/sulfonate/bicarbonate transport system substrate-binding protein [Methylorubrum pseudosasae]MDH6635222.1 ABC-type nitrate/sulfonate/bicarbonate transport system substrate-binding protein [Methylobacterium sp. SuP10 SLI 274]MDH6664391.1 ABC-type nitrate/sulfonate/bicarbonate transport system substrate-binding protein [Methylorubrum zatmanii]MCP1561393.1 NitT/TauT family tran
MIDRRSLLAGLGAGLVASSLPGRVARAQSAPTVIRMGSLKLIHSIAPHFYERFTPEGVRVEVIPFESPTEGKNAVVTKSVDFGMFGLAAATLGAAAGEPIVVIASTCNRGMGVIARKDSDIRTIKDLRGKRVAIWPGSTQEVFALERMRMEGLSVKDITPVRISFSEMHLALARGDVDAYVGAEPAPGVSLASGIGQLVEYPYGTEMGSLNMVFGAHRDTLAERPDLVRTMLQIHRKATEFAAKDREAMIAMAVAKLGQKREALAISAPNVELTWKLGPDEVRQAKIYADRMLALKQIKRLPEDGFIDTRFVDAMRDA